MSQDVSLVFDISSSSVAAAIFSCDKQKPIIFWQDRITVPSQVSLSIDQLEKSILKALREVSTIARKEILGKMLTNIVCVYGAPWHISKHVSISINRDTPFSVTPKFLESVVAKEEEEILRTTARQETPTDGIRIVDKTITHIRLNGYSVDVPYQNNVKHMTASLFLALVQNSFIENIESVIHKSVHIKTITHTVLPLAIFSVLRGVMPKEKEFLAVSITEELTEIILSKKGELQATLSFPAGKHTLLRAMQATGQEYQVALSLSRLHLDKSGEPEWTSHVEKHIEQTRDTWISMFTDALRKIAVDSPLPKTIMFVSDTTSRDLFATYVSNQTIDLTNTGTPEQLATIIFDEGPLSDLLDIPTKYPHDSILETEVLHASSIVRNVVVSV